MTGERTRVPRELLERYATSAPRYTSYPTAVDWSGDFDSARYPELLERAAGEPGPLSLYLHIPFCAELCLFCGCNVQITQSRKRMDTYLARLEREIERTGESGIGGRAVSQYHWGGGTPTSLDVGQIERLQGAIERVFHFTPDAERGVEIDPRVTTPEQVRALARLGFSRLSMGVQDFDPRVQEAVRRVQSEARTRALIDVAREAGARSINVDLMYGLPYQTRAGFARTVEAVLDAAPERVALFQYAHVPWMKRHQSALDVDAMPDAAVKIELFLDALERFQDAGYDFLGLDHFALPRDELAVAAREGWLGRNFMGYTTRRGEDMIALGVSAIGEVADTYVQNVPHEPEYVERVGHQGLATFRGHELSDDDRLRRDVILGLMCSGRVDADAIEARHGIDFDRAFAPELEALVPLEADGLVRREERALEVTPLGKLFLRNVAAVFDRYLAARRAKGEDGRRTFSRTL